MARPRFCLKTCTGIRVPRSGVISTQFTFLRSIFDLVTKRDRYHHHSNSKYSSLFKLASTSFLCRRYDSTTACPTFHDSMTLLASTFFTQRAPPLPKASVSQHGAYLGVYPSIHSPYFQGSGRFQKRQPCRGVDEILG